MMRDIIITIERFQREHGGAKPTAITLGDEEWFALRRDVALLPPFPDHDFTIHGVPIRRVKAAGIKIID